MKRTTVLAGVSAGVGVGVATARKVLSGLAPGAPNAGPGPDQRHLAVTVNRPLSEVAPEGRLPERLAALAALASVEVRPAPGDRGTEIHAHLLDDPAEGGDAVRRRLDGEAPVQHVRTALRETKQLLETGEVLSPDRPGTTEPTALNAPLRKATELARGEGVS
jgi:hypothetical protein